VSKTVFLCVPAITRVLWGPGCQDSLRPAMTRSCPVVHQATEYGPLVWP
jgi:hypothetical protein